MKKLVFTLLSIGFFFTLNSQIQTETRYVFPFVTFQENSSTILVQKNRTQSIGIDYGRAINKRFFATINSIYFTGHFKNITTNSLRSAIELKPTLSFLLTTKSRFQPYISIGSSYFVSKTNNFRKNSSFAMSFGAGAYYFLNPNLAINTNLGVFTEDFLRLNFGTTPLISNIKMEISLVNFTNNMILDVKKEALGERFLHKNKTYLSVATALYIPYFDSGTFEVYPSLNLRSEYFLSKNIMLGLTSSNYSESGRVRPFIGFYGKINPSIYLGATVGTYYQYENFSPEKTRTNKFLPTINALYFLNKTCAGSLEIGRTFNYSNNLNSSADFFQQIYGNIGLKYFLN